jgi:hypothetical protein
VTSGQRTGIFPKAYDLEVADVYAVGDGKTLLTINKGDGVRLWKASEAQALPTRK